MWHISTENYLCSTTCTFKFQENGKQWIWGVICVHRILRHKKGQKKNYGAMSRANMRFPISDKIIDKLYTKEGTPLFCMKPHVPIRLDTKIPTLILLFLLLSISSTYLHCLSNDKYKILPYLHAVALLCKWSGNFSQKLFGEWQ